MGLVLEPICVYWCVCTLSKHNVSKISLRVDIKDGMGRLQGP